MGLTMAEAFILICFALLLLFAFWQWETEKKNTPAVQAFKELTIDQRQTILKSVRDGSIAVFMSLKESGADFAAPSTIEKPKDKWRFIDKSELLRLTDAASELPEDIQRNLADLVEAGQAEKLLKEMALLEELVRLGQGLEGISGKLRQAESQEAALVSALRSELGGVVSGIGGRIDDTGAIVLPDQVLFKQGQAVITPSLAKFMADACEPWLATLRNSGIDIREAKIEGHASSEWRRGSSPREAYLGNLDLSQRRSQAVLRTCLDFVTEPELLIWARAHLIAVGYSSVRPVLGPDGREDEAASRRVVFSVTPNKQSLLEDIQKQADTAKYDRSLFGGWVDLDGDCQNTRQEVLQKMSTGALSYTSNNCIVTRGKWVDPYTGKTFTSARDVEVDHLVPVRWAWDHGALSWPADKRAAFVNDLSNLFIVDRFVNQRKGAKGPDKWLPPSDAFRCQYVTRFQRVVLKYGMTLSEEEREKFKKILKEVCS